MKKILIGLTLFMSMSSFANVENCKIIYAAKAMSNTLYESAMPTTERHFSHSLRLSMARNGINSVLAKLDVATDDEAFRTSYEIIDQIRDQLMGWYVDAPTKSWLMHKSVSLNQKLVELNHKLCL